jgi:chromosomal replication initiation ATPase DnaA
MEIYKSKLKNIVAEAFDVPVEFYERGRLRKRKEMYAKKAYLALMKKYLCHTILEVAQYIGCEEHSGTLYHINDANFMLKYDDAFTLRYTISETELLKLMEQ